MSLLNKRLVYRINDQQYDYYCKYSGVRIKNNQFDGLHQDLCESQKWYQKGYTVEKMFQHRVQFEDLKISFQNYVVSLIKSCLGIDCNNFTLEKYHKYVKDDYEHQKVIKGIDTKITAKILDKYDLVPLLENIMGFDLTNYDDHLSIETKNIVRIVRPNSNDYNPPHKDIDETIDKLNYSPNYVNFWIPIAGVNTSSSLPIVPKSHLLADDKINRIEGSYVFNGNQYKVRLIENWDGDNKLIRSKINYNQVLIFSNRLIHGLAVNAQKDITRISLELRLYKK